MSQMEMKILYTMKSRGMEDKYYLLDKRFKKNYIPLIDNYHIGIAIDNSYEN